MSVSKMPKHYWQTGDVVPVFGARGYEGKGRIARRLPHDDYYLIDWGDGATSERRVTEYANRQYLDFKRTAAQWRPEDYVAG